MALHDIDAPTHSLPDGLACSLTYSLSPSIPYELTHSGSRIFPALWRLHAKSIAPSSPYMCRRVYWLQRNAIWYCLPMIGWEPLSPICFHAAMFCEPSSCWTPGNFQRQEDILVTFDGASLFTNGLTSGMAECRRHGHSSMFLTKRKKSFLLGSIDSPDIVLLHGAFSVSKCCHHLTYVTEKNGLTAIMFPFEFHPRCMHDIFWDYMWRVCWSISQDSIVHPLRCWIHEGGKNTLFVGL